MRSTLEGLKYTDRAIESYQGIYDSTREQVENMGYTGEAMQRMHEYTSRKIEEVQSNHDYWLKLIHEIEDDRHRNILLLKYIEGLTFEDAAEELFYTVGHVYTLTNQAIKELAELHERG